MLSLNGSRRSAAVCLFLFLIACVKPVRSADEVVGKDDPTHYNTRPDVDTIEKNIEDFKKQGASESAITAQSAQEKGDVYIGNASILSGDISTPPSLSETCTGQPVNTPCGAGGLRCDGAGNCSCIATSEAQCNVLSFGFCGSACQIAHWDGQCFCGGCTSAPDNTSGPQGRCSLSGWTCCGGACINGTCGESVTAAPQFIFQKPFTNVQITIKDEGVGITGDQKDYLFRLLTLLPVTQLTGLHQITIRPSTNQPPLPIAQPDGSSGVIINILRGSDPALPAMGSELSVGLGLHVYETQFSTTEYKQWADLTGLPNETLRAGAFEDAYYRYVYNTQSTFQQALEGGQPGIDVPRLLVIAAVFGNPRTQVTNLFSLQKADVKQDYGRMWQDSQWITVGPYSFAIKGGTIIGWTTDDPYTNPKYALHAFNSPIPIPAIALNRILHR